MACYPYMWYLANTLDPNNQQFQSHNNYHRNLIRNAPQMVLNHPPIIPISVNANPSLGSHIKKDKLAPFVDKDGFHVSLEVQHFAPHEITVKAIDNTIVVECKHEERQDEHGYITRHFIRRYIIPKECNIDSTESTLSSDGHLTIKSPRQTKASERLIEILKIGPTKEKPKESKKKVTGDNKKK